MRDIDGPLGIKALLLIKAAQGLLINGIIKLLTNKCWSLSALC
jgi:hypothetical protein